MIKFLYIISSIVERLGALGLAFVLSRFYGLDKYGEYVYYLVFFEILFATVHFNAHERIIVSFTKSGVETGQVLVSILAQCAFLLSASAVIVGLLLKVGAVVTSGVVIGGLLSLVASRVGVMILGALLRVETRDHDYLKFITFTSILSFSLGYVSLVVHESVDYIFLYQSLAYVLGCVLFVRGLGLGMDLTTVRLKMFDVSFSLPLLLSRYGMMMTTAGNKVLLATYISKSVLGSYSIFLMIASIIEIVGDGLSKADMISFRDWEMKSYFRSKGFKKTFALLTFLLISVMLFGPFVFWTITNSELFSYELFVLVVLGIYIKTINKFGILKLYMNEKSYTVLWIYLFSGLCSILFSFFFLRRFGYVGIGLSVILVYILQLIITLRCVRTQR